MIPNVTQPFSIVTNTSLLADRVVLLQPNPNTDLHSYTYFSHTFSSVQRNYDIYDRNLLALILALEN